MSLMIVSVTSPFGVGMYENLSLSVSAMPIFQRCAVSSVHPIALPPALNSLRRDKSLSVSYPSYRTQHLGTSFAHSIISQS